MRLIVAVFLWFSTVFGAPALHLKLLLAYYTGNARGLKVSPNGTTFRQYYRQVGHQAAFDEYLRRNVWKVRWSIIPSRPTFEEIDQIRKVHSDMERILSLKKQYPNVFKEIDLDKAIAICRKHGYKVSKHGT